MRLGRRDALGLAIAATLTGGAGPADAIELWQGAPPGGAGPVGGERVSARGAISNVARPRITVFRPSRPNGMAALVVAGGGYVRIEAGNESTPVSRWLQAQGITAFELIYRLPGEGWSRDAPFQDGQRALQLIRAGASGYGIDPRRVGALGFSAGGHLVGMVAARAGGPNFCGLLYPVLTMMPPFDHTRSRRELLGAHPSEAESAAYSVERLVTASYPPTFLAQAADDPISPVDNSLMMFAALRAAKVAAELHVFQTGGHGWGMGKQGSETREWPNLFEAWLKIE